MARIFPTHKPKITWQVIDVEVKKYGDQYNFISVTVSCQSNSSGLRFRPDKNDVLHDAQGTYQGEKGKVVFNAKTHEFIQLSDLDPNKLRYGFRSKEKH